MVPDDVGGVVVPEDVGGVMPDDVGGVTPDDVGGVIPDEEGGSGSGGVVVEQEILPFSSVVKTQSLFVTMIVLPPLLGVIPRGVINEAGIKLGTSSVCIGVGISSVTRSATTS